MDDRPALLSGDQVQRLFERQVDWRRVPALQGYRIWIDVNRADGL